MKKIISLIIVSVALSGCATNTYRPVLYKSDVKAERKEHLKSLINYDKMIQKRISDTSYSILTNTSQRICNEKLKPMIGFSVWNNVEPKYFWNRSKMNMELYETTKSTYKLDKELKVKNISKESAAYKAGLRSGDVLISINGKTIPYGSDADDEFEDIIEDIFDDEFQGELSITYSRKGKENTVEFEPKYACPYKVIIKHDSEINAYATQYNEIYVTTGIVDFTESNDELGLIIGHELAHITMSHISKRGFNNLLMSLASNYADQELGTAGSLNNVTQLISNKFSQEQEFEADYVGLYYAARAGYKYKNAGDFWRRMSTKNPYSIYVATSHPTNPKRYLSLKATGDEINNKKVFGEEIIPNLKKEIY